MAVETEDCSHVYDSICSDDCWRCQRSDVEPRAEPCDRDPNVVKGGVIEIRFGGNWNVGIDNIGFSQELIPEPASLLALGAGLAGLMGLRRRSR